MATGALTGGAIGMASGALIGGRHAGAFAAYLFSVLPASCRQNQTMRDATNCRQDAGSTFGVAFKPSLNTYVCGSKRRRLTRVWIKDSR